MTDPLYVEGERVARACRESARILDEAKPQPAPPPRKTRQTREDES